MSDFTPYATQCQLGSMPVLTASVERGFNPRISRFNTGSSLGSHTSLNGRESYVDKVTALLTVPEVAQLETIAMGPPVRWTHPILPGFVGRVMDIGEPVNSGLWGYVAVSFSVIEHRDINTAGATTLTQAKSPAGAQAQAKALWDGLGGEVDDLPDWDDLGVDSLDADAFDDAWSDLSAGFDVMDDAFSGIVDGVAGIGDLTAALDVFSDCADSFVDAVRSIEDELGDAAGAILAAPGQIVQGVRACVDDLAASAQRTAEVLTTGPADLCSIMAGFDLSMDDLDSIMAENGILDPFNLPAGLRVILPLRVANG